MEFNKIFGAAILGVLVAWLAGFSADKIVAPEHLSEPVYKVATLVSPAQAAEAAAPVALEPIAPLLAAANVANGEKLVKACAACHSFDKGGPNKVGPNLWNVVGNHRAHLGDGFAYSAAMKAQADQKWDYESLNAFLNKPKDVVPGTKMAYAGMKKPTDRADVIAYLRSLADSPVALP